MGDARQRVLEMFREHFGTSEPLEKKSMFLNKVPGEDRTDEIVAHGAVIAVMRFEVERNGFTLELRQPGAELFADCAVKNVVRFSGMSGHLKGKTVPGECIRDVLGMFDAGDPLILKKGGKVGPGVALVPSDSLRTAEKAVKIKDLSAPSELPLSPNSGRRRFVEANRSHLLNLEARSARDIHAYIKNRKEPVTASFSGGKDSLAALGILLSVKKDPELLFINTGLEFPETVQYVDDFERKTGLKVRRAEAGDAFWRNVDTFGPPAKDFRWCCKVCKLGPITDLISTRYPHGTITVEGNRMLESFARSKVTFVTKNPFVPNQTNLTPVREWNSSEIWGYIWMKGLMYNPLYEHDFERIGCYLCASCLSSEWRNTERIHPDLYSRWEDHLHAYAEDRGLPPEYVDMGFWRWKVLPPKMVRIAEDHDLDLRPRCDRGPNMKLLKGATSCAAGGYSEEAVVTVPRSRDFSAVADALRTIGDVRYSEEFEIALVRTEDATAKLFGGGQISVTSKTQKCAEEMFERAVKALLRAQMCTSCGICEKRCPQHAITIDDGLHVDPGRCTSCGICESSCMVAHYYDKLI